MAALLDENERALTAFAARLLRGDVERARDAVQEIFLRLCRREDLDGVDRAWLFTATRHLCIDLSRKESRMVSSEETTAEWEGAAAPGRASAPDLALQQAEARDGLAAAVDLLPANQREALRLKFESGLSYAEIATVLGSTEGTVGYWLHAAVKSLRGRLSDSEGLDASSFNGGVL